MPTSYYDRVLDSKQRFTQGTKSAKDYFAQFDEFLTRCNALSIENDVQVLSQFRAGLKEDLRTELLARGVTKLKKAYALVQDLNATKSSYIPKSQTQASKFISSQYSNQFLS